MFVFGKKKYFKKQGEPKASFRDQLHQYFYDAFFTS